MLSDCKAYAMIPVSDLTRVRSFYLDTLGLKVLEEGDDAILLECADGTALGVFVSQGKASGDHTQMTFICADIDAEVADLRSRGVHLESFEMPGATSDEGIYDLGGERGAWFRDPEGNLLAVAQMSGSPA